MPSRKKPRPATQKHIDGDLGAELDRDSDLHIFHKPNPIFGPPPLIVENIAFSTVGHTFGQGPVVFPWDPPTYYVQDFLLDQTGASGADGKMAALKDFDLTTATSYRLNIFPKDRAKRIKIVPPSSAQIFF